MTTEEWRQLCSADVRANRGYPKSIVVLLAFRTAQFGRSRPGILGRAAYVLVGSAYKLLAEWLLGIELPASTRVGAGLRLRHGVGLVVNPASVIGENVMLRQGVTLGNRYQEQDCPIVENDVEIGAGAAVIGRVVVGEGARIGAGAVVVKDVPPRGTAYVRTTIREPRSLPSEED